MNLILKEKKQMIILSRQNIICNQTDGKMLNTNAKTAYTQAQIS